MVEIDHDENYDDVDEEMMMVRVLLKILKTCISDWDFHIDLLLLSYFT